MTDFEKSGIHLPPDRRQRFVDLSDEIQLLGRKFLNDVAAAAAPEEGPGGSGLLAGLASNGKDMIEIPDADIVLQGMGANFIEALPRGSRLGGSRTSRFVGPNSWAAQMIIRHAPNERARKVVYEGCNRYSQERVDVLESLLLKRGELAGVLDKESWAASVLSDKMAKTPENVMGFLTSLAKHHRRKAQADVGLLAKLKQMETASNRVTPNINAWDRDYFSERYVAAIAPGTRVHPINPFFSAGTVIQGLSRLFTNLYGIRFVPCALRPGEAWDKDVRKVHVVDEAEGLIGSIYFDLFSRPGKSPNAAHYTVRCSRRIDDDDLPGDRLPADWDFSAGMTGVEDYHGVEVKGKPGRYQLPLVVLTTDFARPSFQDGPSLLAWQEVETLFHEMGHAIHCESILPLQRSAADEYIRQQPCLDGPSTTTCRERDALQTLSNFLRSSWSRLSPRQRYCPCSPDTSSQIHRYRKSTSRATSLFSLRSRRSRSIARSPWQCSIKYTIHRSQETPTVSIRRKYITTSYQRRA